MSYTQLAESVDRLNETNQELLDSILDTQYTRKLANYPSLRSYKGVAKVIVITEASLYGQFIFDPKDTTSLDNSGTIIIDALKRRWKRLYWGPAKLSWFNVKYDGTDETLKIQNAADSVFTWEIDKGNLNFSTVRIRQGSHISGLSRTDTSCTISDKGFLIIDGGIKKTTRIVDMCLVPAGKAIPSGVCSSLTNFFSLNAVEVHRVDFRGPDSNASGYGQRTPDFFFSKNIDTRMMSKISTVDVNVTGGYKVEEDPATQPDSYAIYTEGTSIGVHMDNFNVRSVKDVWVLTDNVEGYFIDNCEWVYVNRGLVTNTTTNKPGGWIGKLHVNCALMGINLKNRNVFSLGCVSVLRASFYFPQPTWDAIKLENCQRFTVEELNIRPDVTGLPGVRKGLSVIGCVGGSLGSGAIAYMNHGVHVEGSDGFNVGIPRFESCSSDVTITSTASNTVVGDATSNTAELKIANSSPSTRLGRNSGYYSVDGGTTTITAAGNETWQQSISSRTRRLRFNMTAAGVYTFALSTVGCRKGDSCKFSVRFDNTLTTLSFTSSSVQIHSHTPSGVGGYVFEFEFTGTDWRIVSACVSTHT